MLDYILYLYVFILRSSGPSGRAVYGRSPAEIAG